MVVSKSTTSKQSNWQVLSTFTQPSTMPVSQSTSLYYRVDGLAQLPTLMLLHGGPGAQHDYLYPQMLDLARDHRLYTYDQRGGGQSKTDDPSPITWHTHVADLGRLIDEFKDEYCLRPLTLIGYSWGALLAMLYAIESARSESLIAPARMVLISPAPITRAWRNQFETALAARNKGPVVEAMRRELNESGLKESNPEAYRQRSFELAVAGYFHDPRNATSLTPFRVTGKVQQSVWDSLGDYDLRPSLCAIKCPVLVVHGDSDPIPLESAKAAAESMCGLVRFAELERCGHVPYVEQPEILFRTIRSFLSDTASS